MAQEGVALGATLELFTSDYQRSIQQVKYFISMLYCLCWSLTTQAVSTLIQALIVALCCQVQGTA